MNIYDKLKKIKRPVLIDVTCRYSNYEDRFRILYPDGEAEWDFIDGIAYETPFVRSCYYDYGMKLNTTVNEMQRYDKRNGLRIKKIIQL